MRNDDLERMKREIALHELAVQLCKEYGVQRLGDLPEAGKARWYAAGGPPLDSLLSGGEVTP